MNNGQVEELVIKMNKAAFLLGQCTGMVSSFEAIMPSLSQEEIKAEVSKFLYFLIKGVDEIFYTDSRNSKE